MKLTDGLEWVKNSLEMCITYDSLESEWVVYRESDSGDNFERHVYGRGPTLARAIIAARRFCSQSVRDIELGCPKEVLGEVGQ